MPDVQAFIDRWKRSGATERSNCQPFVTELCGVIGVAPPEPATDRPEDNTYCFERAVHLTAEQDGSTGFITTNSIRQTFNRKVVEKEMKVRPPLSLAFAIPDHPWVDSVDGSDVRIAMTVGATADQPGTLQTMLREAPTGEGHRSVELAEKHGNILPDLTIGADVAGGEPLEANADLSGVGVMLAGSGFIVEPEGAEALGLGEIDGLENPIRPYRNGRDLAQLPREVMVIDLFGLEAEEVRDQFPAVYQHVRENVKPERDQNRRKSRRETWWIFGEPISTLRPALKEIGRYIATPEVAKHRFFQFLDESILPDKKLVVIVLNDACHLGVLSSHIHVTWALAAGGRLGVGNDPRYNNTQCFDPFPFPAASETQKAQIRRLAEHSTRTVRTGSRSMRA